MQPLPDLIRSAAAVRAADQHAINVLGIPGYTLMTRAGEAAFAAIRAEWPAARRLLVLCGRGNNGGDGYVVARLARAAGLEVTVAAPAGLPAVGDARRAAADWAAAGGLLSGWSDVLAASAEVIVDALLGTGLDREVGAPLAQVIAVLNALALPIAALDTPSGLDADTGFAQGIAVRAALTISFVGLKAGCFLGDGPEHTGRLVFDGLGLPTRVFGDAPPILRRISEAERLALLPRRPRAAHKGSNGRVLIIAGGPGMPGAARLAGEAALRAGAGLVTLATLPAHAALIAAAAPELICRPVESPAELVPLLQAADVVAVGPGLGRSAWSEPLVHAAFSVGAPLIVDADALNLLATAPRRRERWCLTPHPGEAARLLGTDIAAVQHDRLGAVEDLHAVYGGVAVLKGAGTLIAAGEGVPWICERGNPGMASAGMGDALCGVIAAIAGQQPEPGQALGRAAAVGVWAHATAGDRAAGTLERGLTASDLIAQLRACVNPAG